MMRRCVFSPSRERELLLLLLLTAHNLHTGQPFSPDSSSSSIKHLQRQTSYVSHRETHRKPLTTTPTHLHRKTTYVSHRETHGNQLHLTPCVWCVCVCVCVCVCLWSR